MRNALRSFRASIENRSEIHFSALPIPFGDANDVTSILGVVPEALGASLGLPKDACGQLLATLRPPGASLDRPWAGHLGIQKPSRPRPEVIPKTILDAQDSSRSIFCRFWHDLAWISDDFRPIFHRFSVEPPATKPQNRKLEKESCDPRCPTWHLWCAVASCCSCVFRNGF